MPELGALRACPAKGEIGITLPHQQIAGPKLTPDELPAEALDKTGGSVRPMTIPSAHGATDASPALQPPGAFRKDEEVRHGAEGVMGTSSTTRDLVSIIRVPNAAVRHRG